MGNTKQEIVIKIEESLDANNSFEVNNLLQKRAIEKINKLVENRLNKDSDCSNRKHDTITILGERGSGKTSLLLNLKTILENYENKLVFLRIIDPTLFETKQNILVSIISLIADEVKDRATDEWSQSLVELGNGLKLLDGIGSDIIKSDIFDDGALILEKGLDHASSGLKLEENLNKFICQSLSILSEDKKEEKKMFILVFDDIDTNIDKGWMILETIRKYLTSCKLQVFVSGDWELYSSLVRMKQWENFDKKILPEKEWHDKKDLVDVLEEQYLIKVLKPEYRIYLENFYQLTKKAEKISVEGFEKKESIESIYQEVSKTLFNFQNKSQQEEVSNLIKQLPIRTNMKIFYAHLINKNDTEELINAISNVFITNTARFKFTHLDYENLSPNVVMQEMAKKLYLLSDKQFSFEKLIQFPMNLSNKDINLLLMVINLHLTKTLSTNMYTFFEWLTRFTYLEILEDDKQTEDGKNELLSKLKYDSTISMKEQINLISQVYIQARNSLIGFKSIYTFHKYAKVHGYIGADKFQESGNIDENFLLDILLSKSGRIAHAEQSSISIINLFSFLHEFLQKSHEEAQSYLISIFEDFHYFNGNDHLFASQKTDDILNNNLYKSLLEWHKLKDTVEIFSILQINNIWKSFLEKNDNEIQSKKITTVKDFISTQIIVFFNLLITEILFNKGIYKSYSSVTSPSNLYRNIENAYGKTYSDNFYNDYKELDFFKYMYLCPILYCFVDDAKFVIPDTKYWITKEDKNRITTSFGTLRLQAGSQKEVLLNDINNKETTDIILESTETVEKYISKSDLDKITQKDFKTIENVITEVKNGKIKTRDQLWKHLKTANERATTIRKSILDRFLINIQNDIKTDDL